MNLRLLVFLLSQIACLYSAEEEYRPETIENQNNVHKEQLQREQQQFDAKQRQEDEARRLDQKNQEEQQKGDNLTAADTRIPDNEQARNNPTDVNRKNVDQQEKEYADKIAKLKTKYLDSIKGLFKDPRLESAFAKVMGDAGEDIINLVEKIGSIKLEEFTKSMNSIAQKIKAPSTIYLSELEYEAIVAKSPDISTFLNGLADIGDIKLQNVTNDVSNDMGILIEDFKNFSNKYQIDTSSVGKGKIDIIKSKFFLYGLLATIVAPLITLIGAVLGTIVGFIGGIGGPISLAKSIKAGAIIGAGVGAALALSIAGASLMECKEQLSQVRLTSTERSSDTSMDSPSVSRTRHLKNIKARMEQQASDFLYVLRGK